MMRSEEKRILTMEPKSKIYKIQKEEPKPKKKKNEKNRKRNNIINFRVTENERELIERRISLSGMKRVDYFIESCLYQAILVKGNIKTFDKIRERLSAIESKLSDMEKNPELSKDDILELRTILEMLVFVYKRKR